MEVWALYAYGAAHVLQEILTVKADDIIGRVKVYESLVKGKVVNQAGVPESFRVLVKEFQALGLDVQVVNNDDEVVEFKDVEEEDADDTAFRISELDNKDLGITPNDENNAATYGNDDIEESLEPEDEEFPGDTDEDEDVDLDDLEFPGDEAFEEEGE